MSRNDDEAWEDEAPARPAPDALTLLLADHIPTPVARTSAHGGDWRMRCCCGAWNGWDYDLPDHYARVLADAGLLKEDT